MEEISKSITTTYISTVAMRKNIINYMYKNIPTLKLDCTQTNKILHSIFTHNITLICNNLNNIDKINYDKYLNLFIDTYYIYNRYLFDNDVIENDVKILIEDIMSICGRYIFEEIYNNILNHCYKLNIGKNNYVHYNATYDINNEYIVIDILSIFVNNSIKFVSIELVNELEIYNKIIHNYNELDTSINNEIFRLLVKNLIYTYINGIKGNYLEFIKNNIEYELLNVYKYNDKTVLEILDILFNKYANNVIKHIESSVIKYIENITKDINNVNIEVINLPIYKNNIAEFILVLLPKGY